MLALTGKAIEGETLTAVEVIPKSEAQQLAWNKYKKHVRYQWYALHLCSFTLWFCLLPRITMTSLYIVRLFVLVSENFMQRETFKLEKEDQTCALVYSQKA